MTTQSLHYFHSYAVQDRVDTTAMSVVSCPRLTSAESLLPTAADLQQIVDDFKVVSR